MKIKWLVTAMTSVLLATGYAVFASAQGTTGVSTSTSGTNITNPTTDFGRDVKNGIASTQNDPVAKGYQQKVKDNEMEEGREDGDKDEVKEVEQEKETPETENETEKKTETEKNSGEVNNTEQNRNGSEGSSTGERQTTTTQSTGSSTAGGESGD